ncbi:hypothetical protein CDL15_Pgr013345 [Punica granatum]|uniref:adenylate kinase n=1 Tax=Punica granatum TaxID=22663 RepID=A0A218WQF8_PUNGR|nr:hypothetical protein CDL15_Pgr013345 [Punica granatum]
MPLYDCVLLLKPHVKKDAMMELVARVGKHVFRRNGVLTEIKSFGTVQLGYGIKKLDGRYFKGQLMQMTMMATPNINKELHYLNKEDRLLRWLLVKHRETEFGLDFLSSDDEATQRLIKKKPTVVFVLVIIYKLSSFYPQITSADSLSWFHYLFDFPGGPGSGKGTQCANIVKHFGFTHLSAGDLLRAEIKSGSENGTMIENMIKEGKIVPSEVTIKLLQNAMLESGNDKFLIDGFPRNEENRAAFEAVTKIEPAFVLFFECSEEEMERRLLSRNQGREDDNIETIRKRFKSSMPVVEYYESKGKVRKIDAAKPIEEVFEAVKTVFTAQDDKVKWQSTLS